MDLVGPNFIARPYRGVSVQEVPTLDGDALRAYVLARRVYRRTEFLVCVAGEERTVLQVERAPGDDILVPVADVRVLAAPAEVAFIDDESVDTGNASQLARAALASGLAARVYVVQGMFQHVNIIVEPTPLVVRVVEVIPPEPPKLLEMARAMLDIDEDLPPIELVFEPIDLRDLMVDGARNLLPCRSGGLTDVDFLDAGPPLRADWTLVGCERSRQIFASMYGAAPADQVDFCPRVRASFDSPTLFKCCMHERGIERVGGQAVWVPWGANLDEVRAALRLLAGLDAAPAPVAVAS